MVAPAYRRFGSELATTFAGVLLVDLAAIWFLPLMTKGLGAEAYGTWAQVQVTLSLGIGIAGMGLPYAMSRFLSTVVDRNTMADDFWSAFVIVGAVAVVVAFVFLSMSEVVARGLFDGQIRVVQITAALLVTWALDTVCLNFLRARREIRVYAVLTVAHKYLSLGAIVVLVLRGEGLLSALVALLAVQLVLLMYLLAVVCRRIGFIRPRFKRTREYLAFGVPTIPGNMSSWVVHASDRYVIGFLLGMGSVGVYAAGFAVGHLCVVLGSVIGFVSPAALSQLHEEGRVEEVRTILSTSLKYSLVLAIPFVFGVVALGEPVLRLLSTEEIASTARVVAVLIAVSTVLQVAYVSFVQPLVLVKRTPVTARIWLAAAVLNLVLNLLLVPRIGIVGAAIGTVIAHILALVWIFARSRNILRIPVDWGFVAKILGASTIMWLVTSRMPAMGLWTTLGAVLTGILVYLVGLMGMKAVTTADLRVLCSTLWRRR